MKAICEEAGIESCAAELTGKVPEKMEITKRIGEKGEFWFCLNHLERNVLLRPDIPVTDVAAGKHYAPGEAISFAPYDVKILRKG